MKHFVNTSMDDGDDNDAVYAALQVEYKDMASWYDAFWKSYTDGTLKKPLKEVLKEINHIGSAGFSLVDIGCGTGAFLRSLLDIICPKFTDGNGNGDGEDTTLSSSFNLIGVEPSKEMLHEAQKKFSYAEGTNAGSGIVTLNNSPAEHLPLDDGCVNMVVSTNAFHFFRDKDKALQEMKRVLKQNGTLIITDWCNNYWIVKLYHFLEKIRWNWRFNHRYPSPLSSSNLTDIVRSAGFCEVTNTAYRVRVFSIFFWGMQTVKAKKR